MIITRGGGATTDATSGTSSPTAAATGSIQGPPLAVSLKALLLVWNRLARAATATYMMAADANLTAMNTRIAQHVQLFQRSCRGQARLLIAANAHLF
jgi:hypothetical protein